MTQNRAYSAIWGMGTTSTYACMYGLQGLMQVDFGCHHFPSTCSMMVLTLQFGVACRSNSISPSVCWCPPSEVSLFWKFPDLMPQHACITATYWSDMCAGAVVFVPRDWGLHGEQFCYKLWKVYVNRAEDSSMSWLSDNLVVILVEIQCAGERVNHRCSVRHYQVSRLNPLQWDHIWPGYPDVCEGKNIPESWSSKLQVLPKGL